MTDFICDDTGLRYPIFICVDCGKPVEDWDNVKQALLKRIDIGASAICRECKK